MNDIADALARRVAEDQRRQILQLLESQEDGSASDRTLTLALRDLGEGSTTRDQVRDHVLWLSEQRLVTHIELGDGTLIATISERGANVAAGRSRTAGVARKDRI